MAFPWPLTTDFPAKMLDRGSRRVFSVLKNRTLFCCAIWEDFCRLPEAGS